MAKITVEGNVYEGTVEELKEIFEMMGVEFPNKSVTTVCEDVPVGATEEEPLKVGDYAKVVDGAPDNIGVIVEITDLDYAVATLNPINSSFPGYSHIDRLRKATDEEVAEAKAKLLPKLSVGDYVKTLTESKHGSIGAGEILVITDTDFCEGQILADSLVSKDRDGIYLPSQLVEATDEEVKFAKIGRKPNEFKKGDIVKVKKPCGAPLNAGDIVEVKYDSSSYFSVFVTEKAWAVSVSELITPVEARFDHE